MGNCHSIQCDNNTCSHSHANQLNATYSPHPPLSLSRARYLLHTSHGLVALLTIHSKNCYFCFCSILRYFAICLVKVNVFFLFGFVVITVIASQLIRKIPC